MKASKHRISPALAISCVALFASLGGVSYGVATNSIDSREIKDNSVQGKDMRSNTVTAREIKGRSIDGTDIKLNRVGGNAVKEEVLEAGKIGKVLNAGTADNATNAGTADNATNAANAANATNLGGSPAASYAKDLGVFPTGLVLAPAPTSEAVQSDTETCPAGKRIVSGGYILIGAGANDVTVNENRVLPAGDAYKVEATEIGMGTAETWSVVTRIVCATAN